MPTRIAISCLAAGLLAASGCQTLEPLRVGGGGPRVVEVVTDPPGVLLTIEGFGECETPCNVEVDMPRAARLSRTGYESRQFEITPDKRRIEITLNLVGATTGVDSATLPEIE